MGALSTYTEYRADQAAWEAVAGHKIPAWAWDEATEYVLGDIDSLADKIGAQALRRAPDADFVLRFPDLRIPQADDCTLLAVALVAVQRGNDAACVSAIKRIAARWLAERAGDVAERADYISDPRA